MDIRIIQPNEYIKYDAICKLVFYDMERRDYWEMMQNPYAYAQTKDLIWAAFDYNGKLCSGMTVTPQTMRLNGRSVEAALLRGVATRPESRRRGFVVHILRAAFQRMREDGQHLSFIFPHSFAYYKRYGYGLCHSYNQATIPIKNFEDYSYPTSVEPFSKGAPFNHLVEIYDSFTADKNLAILRNQEHWTDILNRDHYMELRFTYIHHDSAGVPDAYVLYSPKQEGREYILEVEECSFKSVAALHGILGFFGRLAAEYSAVRWNVPDGINIHSLFKEPGKITCENKPACVGRIIDAEAALALIAPPQADGSVAISVADDFLPDNSGTYLLEWSGGSLQVNRTNADAALEIGVDALAQLITGYLTIDKLLYRRGVVLRDAAKLAELRALFPPKELYMVL